MRSLGREVGRARRHRALKLIQEGIASLDLERATLNKIPTWPWEPGSIRGVVAALLLPLGIWLIQNLLTRWLG